MGGRVHSGRGEVSGTRTLGAGALLLLASVAEGQPAPAASSPAATVSVEAIRTAKRTFAREAGTPGQADFSRTGAEAILTASSADSKATARIGLEIAERWFVDSTFTSPLDKNLSRTLAVAASRTPLADDAKFTLGFGRLDWTYRTDAVAAARICADVAQRSLGPCNTVNPNLPADVVNALRNTVSIGTAFTYGARFSLGRTKFDYRVTPEGATTTEHHYTPVAFTGGVGALLPSNLFLGVRAGYERVVNGKDPKTLCSPADDSSNVLSCEDVAVGIPTSDKGPLVILEARRVFSWGAVAPRFEYRHTKDLVMFELPVYFLHDPDKASDWTGGLLVRVKKSEVSVGIFVGPALPYFGLKN
jgi:hypothetical protein